MTQLVGLTGGISCGKSVVASQCIERGLPVVDCDAIARDCTRKGAWGWSRVRSAFKGYDVFEPDGSINRRKLGDIVFKDVKLQRRLNKATHLPIQIQMACTIMYFVMRLTPTVVVDMPLLFETKSGWLFNDIIVVTCDHEQQLQRLCNRDSCTEGEALDRIRAQMPQAYKAAHATILIDNSGSIAATRQQVDAAVDNVTKKSRALDILLLPLGLGAIAFVAYLARYLTR